jgi:hypothetical protein
MAATVAVARSSWGTGGAHQGTSTGSGRPASAAASIARARRAISGRHSQLKYGIATR